MMNDLTELEITEEKLLIYTNDQECERIRADIEMRASELNAVAKHGLSKEEIQLATSSEFKLNQYVENQLLKENPEYARIKQAGISGITAKPSDRLQSLKDALLQLMHRSESVRRGADPFMFLNFENNVWRVNEIELENFLIRHQFKVYLSGEKLNEFNEILGVCKFLEKYEGPNNQISSISFLSSRIECVSRHKFIPRWTWFLNK